MDLQVPTQMETDAPDRAPCLFSATTHKLEVEPEFRGDGPGRDVMSPAEGGKEVVERIFVGQVDKRKLRAPFVFVAAKQVVMAQ